MKTRFSLFSISTAAFLTGAAPDCGAAEESPAKKRPVDGIMDNSFLIEEAYNQE